MRPSMASREAMEYRLDVTAGTRNDPSSRHVGRSSVHGIDPEAPRFTTGRV